MIRAVIEIGSTGIRLTVAESAQDADGESGIIKVLDRSELPVSLGRDVFTDGSISFETLSSVLSILVRMKEQLAGWGIKAEDATVIATSALREAKMRDTVVDRILVKTGFRTRVIDGIEENRLMYLAVTDTLKGAARSLSDEDSIILEVGGGSTEMMLMRRGKMAGAHSLKLGTVRVERQLHSKSLSVSDISRFIEEFIRNTKGSLDNELNLKGVRQFLMVGNDATVAAVNAGKPISTFLWRIERVTFEKFVNEVQQYSVEELSARFKIPYSEAQTMGVSLLIYRMFVHLTDVSDIIVSETNIRWGVLHELSGNDRRNSGGGAERGEVTSEELEDEFSAQVTSSAMNLLHRYRGDENHAEYVRQMAKKIYSVLASEMGEERDELLLEVSAILHDIGFFIKADKHNEHSAYIIKNSDIFGLSHHERSLVSMIAKYHRGGDMPQDDDRFQSLASSDRMKILKLSSVLRVADALDRGHSGRLSNVRIALEDDTLVLRTDAVGSALERIAVAEKSDMFKSVFGYKVELV